MFKNKKPIDVVLHADKSYNLTNITSSSPINLSFDMPSDSELDSNQNIYIFPDFLKIKEENKVSKIKKITASQKAYEYVHKEMIPQISSLLQFIDNQIAKLTGQELNIIYSTFEDKPELMKIWKQITSSSDWTFIDYINSYYRKLGFETYNNFKNLYVSFPEVDFKKYYLNISWNNQVDLLIRKESK